MTRPGNALRKDRIEPLRPPPGRRRGACAGATDRWTTRSPILLRTPLVGLARALASGAMVGLVLKNWASVATVKSASPDEAPKGL